MNHEDLAKDNEKISKYLKKGGYGDWALTAVFYSALHWVHVAHPNCPKGHGNRRNYLANNVDRATFTIYEFLRNESENTRYEPPLAEHARDNADLKYPLVFNQLTQLKIKLKV